MMNTVLTFCLNTIFLTLQFLCNICFALLCSKIQMHCRTRWQPWKKSFALCAVKWPVCLLRVVRGSPAGAAGAAAPCPWSRPPHPPLPPSSSQNLLAPSERATLLMMCEGRQAGGHFFYCTYFVQMGRWCFCIFNLYCQLVSWFDSGRQDVNIRWCEAVPNFFLVEIKKALSLW